MIKQQCEFTGNRCVKDTCENCSIYAINNPTVTKESWEKEFQKWSNEIFTNSDTHYGACGSGYICSFCYDNSYGKPCVRALNAMCRELFLPLDYTNKSDEYFKKCFDGRLK